MLKLIQRWFSLPEIPINDEDTQRAVMLNLMNNVMLFFAVVGVVGTLVGGRTPLAASVLTGALGVNHWVVRRILRRGTVAQAAAWTIVASYLELGALIVTMGTIRVPASALFLLFIMFTGLMFNVRGIVLATLTSSGMVLGLVLAESRGLLPQPNLSVSLTQWITFTVLFGVTGFLTYFAQAFLRRALHQLSGELRERIQAETALRQSEAKYRIVADNTYSWEFWQDPQGVYVYISPACQNVCGYTAEELMANPRLPRELVYPEDAPLVDLHNKIVDGRIGDQVDFRIVHRDGSIRWIGHACQPIINEQGEYLGVRGSNRDITEAKRAEEALRAANEQLRQRVVEVEQLQTELREQALRDPLTGLSNRRYLDEILPHVLQWAEREKTGVSVIVADIDRFKRINDTYGHSVGDLFLVQFAVALKRSTRGMDAVCRYGGEEFVIVLPGAGLAAAAKRAEEIRQTWSEVTVAHDGMQLRTTVSLGVAAYPEHGRDADTLIIKADQAMYTSKNNGRNLVTIWTEPEQSADPIP